MAGVKTALEVGFFNDTNVYFLPVIEGGLAVRHVALHVRRLFKIDHDVVICKPGTRFPLPGGLVLLPGRAVTVCSALQRKVVVASSSSVLCQDGMNDEPPAVPLLQSTVAPETNRYTAPSLTVRVDAVVCPEFKRGVAAYCVYEPLRTASRDAILAVKTNDLRISEYQDGSGSRNAAECELRAFADALCHADGHAHCGPETRIDVVLESTYCIQVVRKLQTSAVMDVDMHVARIQAVLNRRVVRMKWASTLTRERGRPGMTDLRRAAVAACRRKMKSVSV